jgi:hypothetical protein
LFNLEPEDLEMLPGTQQGRETPDKKTGYQFTETDHRKEFNSIPDIQNKADGYITIQFSFIK